MKRLIIFLMLLAPLVFQAQNSMDTITKALTEGDATTLSSYFAEEVDLLILDDEDLYDKAEATQVVSDFFGTVKKGEYELKHEGVSKLNHQYYIGDFKAENGDEYRITIFMKSEGGAMEISQLRIEEF